MGRLTPSLRARGTRFAENGEATVEFVLFTIAVIIPVAYFIFAMASVQAHLFAVEASAREAARILARNWQDTDFADRQVELVFSDYQLPEADVVESVCEPQPCAAGSLVTVRVSTHVDLPLLPSGWFEEVARLPVSATHSFPVVGVGIAP